VSALERQLRVLSEGHGSITVLEGSPGSGKTRLLTEAANIAGRRGVRVGAGGARRGDRVVMMGALLDAIADGPQPLFARESFRDIEKVPDLRYWLVQEIEAMLERAASAGPILVSVDDLQWADGGTIRAVEGLALRLAGLPIAWLIAWRPAEIPPEVGETLGRLEKAGALRLTLAQLDNAAVAEVVGEVLFSIASMLNLSADTRAAAGRRALELPGLPPRERARHQARLVHNVLVGGRRTQAQRLLENVSDEVHAHGDKATVFSLRLAAGGLRYEEGYFTQSLELIEEAVRAGAVAGEDARARMAQQWRAEVLATADRFDEAVRLAVDGLEAARRASQSWVIHLWEQWRGRQHYQLGEYSDAIAALEGILHPEEPISTFGAGYASGISALSGAAILVGDRPLLRGCAKLAAAMLERGTPEHRRHAAWVLARQAQAEGAGERSVQVLRDVAATLPGREPVLPCFPVDVLDQVALVRLALAVDDKALGRQAVELASERASLNPVIDTVIGAANHARGLLDGDLELLRIAVADFERSPRRPALASALEDQGVIALAQDKKAEAIDSFDRALELTAVMGATWDATRLRRRLRDVGVRRRLAQVERPKRGWEALTTSELAVVEAITSGMTNREAAAHLFLSPHTVSTHMRHVFQKLQVNSRVELARMAAAHRSP
jgi:DNA-binding CsgD family transcriptional regulator